MIMYVYFDNVCHKTWMRSDPETMKLRRINCLWLTRMEHLYIYAHKIVSDILSLIGGIIESNRNNYMQIRFTDLNF